jgi:very-short-patch-repair endonuclease
LDGGQHADQVEYDSMRTIFLERQGYQVLRFWNNDVMNNIRGVIQVISEMLPMPYYVDLSTPPCPPQIRKDDHA